MDPAITENLNYGWSPPDPPKARRLKVILPQIYAALAIFAVNLSHEMFENIMFLVYHHITDYTSTSQIFFAVVYNVILGIGFLMGLVAQIIGARLTVISAGAVSVVGWIILGWISSVTVLQWTFYIVAFVKVMMQAPSYVYLAEISQPNMRNPLMAVICVAANIGSTYILLPFAGSMKMNAFFGIVFALVGLVVMYFLPDSPYWLANKGRYHGVELSLAWFRGRTIPENVKSESQTIIRNAQNSPTAFKLFYQKTFYIPALVVCSIFFANAFVTVFYNTHSWHIYEVPFNRKYRESFYLIWGISTVYISIAFVVLVAIIGKRILVLISLFVGSMALLAASIAGYLNGNDTHHENVYTWILLFCIAVTHFSCITGVVSVPLMLNGELFPSKLRYFGAACGLLFAHVVQVVSSNLYWRYFDFGNGAVLVLAIVSIFGLFFSLQLFPRNENKSLVEIEHSSTDLLKMRRMK